MPHAERLLIYAILVILLVMQAASLQGAASTAVAHAAHQSTSDTLGPAEKLLLSAPAGSDAAELAITNGKERITWGATDSHRTYSMAFVHAAPIVNGIMSLDAYAEDRERLMEELTEREEEFEAEAAEMQRRLGELDQDDPEFQRLLDEWNAVYQEHMQFRRDATERRGEMEAQQLEQAFREMVTAAQIVGERMDIDIVYQFVPADRPFTAVNRTQANREIMLRRLLTMPDGLDLTAEVLDELDLEDTR